MKTDEQTQINVAEELRWEPLLHADHIEVSVKAGKVTLSGCTDSYPKKFTAQQAACRVNGVKSITNNVLVELPVKDKRTDHTIAWNIAKTLEWHTSIPKNKIKIKIKDSCVYLTGEVEFKGQAEATFQAIMNLKGITAINNDILVKPAIDCAYS